jgi:HEAT repeat protein
VTATTDIQRDLDSPDPELRRRATARIPLLPPAEAPDFIIRGLGDGDWRVRKEATQVAVALGPSRHLVEVLVAQLFPGDNVGLRNAVVETLASFGANAVPTVIDAIPRLDADGKKLAAEILGRAEVPSAAGALETLLTDPDPNVRVAAIEAIGGLGQLAIDASSRVLLEAIDAPEVHIRLAALEALNRLGVVVPWEKLRPLTAHRILRRATLSAASRAGRYEAAEMLLGAMDDESHAFFRLALFGVAELALGSEIALPDWKLRLPPLGGRARERLLEAIGPSGGEVETRRAALVVAAVVGEVSAIDIAIDALIDDGVAREADAALRIFGSAALTRILSRVAHGDGLMRAAAIGRLVHLADDADLDVVCVALRGAISDPAPEVASAALGALSALGGPADIPAVFAVVASKPQGSLQAAQAALAALAHRYPEDARVIARVARRDKASRMATSVVIGALRGEVLGAVEDDVAFLTGVLSSADSATRLVAVQAVGEVGSDLGLEAIQFALADEERDIQFSAVRALGQLHTADGRAAGADRLLELLRDPTDPVLTAAAARALGAAADQRACGALRPLCLSPMPQIAVAAVETLGRLDHPEKLDALLEATAHAHAEVVKAVLLALENETDARALDPIGRALTHEAWDVRRLAADCLGRFGGDQAARLLRDRMPKEQEPLVKEAISRALGAIEAPSTMIRPATITPPRAEP